jgi:hypothetical protein
MATAIHTDQMLENHPAGPPPEPVVARCIDSCLDCGQACTACADACLSEMRPHELARCITTTAGCADLCFAAVKIISRQTELDAALLVTTLGACARVCRLCARECERHAAHMPHCRVCAEVCETCADACRNLLERFVV